MALPDYLYDSPYPDWYFIHFTNVLKLPMVQLNGVSSNQIRVGCLLIVWRVEKGNCIMIALQTEKLGPI